MNRDVSITGLSGYTHQIDVVYRMKIWLTEILVLVECKQYKKRVGIDDLLEFKSRLDDLRAHKGVFVTSSGYQSGAIEFARANRIALLVVHATKKLSVLYSLSQTSERERALEQLDDLEKNYQTIKSGHAKRITTDRNFKHVIVQHDGVTLELRPWELHQSMLYKQSCALSDTERNGIYFSRDKFDYLPVNKVLKSIVLDILLVPTDG
nr:restriction endonuclease [Pigmentiphaga litoralis]